MHDGLHLNFFGKSFFWKPGDFSPGELGWDQRRKEKNSDEDLNFIVKISTVQRLGRALCTFQRVYAVKSFIEP